MPPREKYIVVAAIASVPFLTAIDYVTGYDLNFFVFYFLPVAMMGWYAGVVPSTLTAVACAIAWYGADVASGHVYEHASAGIWNGAFRLVSFLLIGWATAKIRKDQRRLSQLNEELSAAVGRLEKSIGQIRELQGEIQLVCAWTKRIKSEGRWMQFEEFMARNFQLRFTHGISEEGIAQLKHEISHEEEGAS